MINRPDTRSQRILKRHKRVRRNDFPARPSVPACALPPARPTSMPRVIDDR